MRNKLLQRFVGCLQQELWSMWSINFEVCHHNFDTSCFWWLPVLHRFAIFCTSYELIRNQAWLVASNSCNLTQVYDARQTRLFISNRRGGHTGLTNNSAQVQIMCAHTRSAKSLTYMKLSLVKCPLLVYQCIWNGNKSGVLHCTKVLQFLNSKHCT